MVGHSANNLSQIQKIIILTVWPCHLNVSNNTLLIKDFWKECLFGQNFK